MRYVQRGLGIDLYPLSKILCLYSCGPPRSRNFCVEKKDAAHYIQALERFRQRHRRLKGVFLIQDGDPSHTAGDTQNYLADANTWWRPRFTPVHASWLNQAEILIHNFSHHYLKRHSWHSRDAFIEHVMAAWPEYNDRYAKPIEWTWTNHKMRRWFEKHAH